LLANLGDDVAHWAHFLSLRFNPADR
jgi:hypothetical protein